MIYSSCSKPTGEFELKEIHKGLTMVDNAYKGKYDYFGKAPAIRLLDVKSSSSDRVLVLEKQELREVATTDLTARV